MTCTSYGFFQGHEEKKEIKDKKAVKENQVKTEMSKLMIWATYILSREKWDAICQENQFVLSIMAVLCISTGPTF